MTAYADSSFLVSLYAQDAHTARARQKLQRLPPPLLISDLGELEVHNALSQCVFRKQITPQQAQAARALFGQDLAGGLFQLVESNHAVFRRARQIAMQRTVQLGTRALDILHVATALEERASAFVTFDLAQARLALVEGLTVP